MVGEALAKGIESLVQGLVILGIVFALIVGGATYFLTKPDDEIRSYDKLEPIRVELEVTNGTQIDSVYIYKLED